MIATLWALAVLTPLALAFVLVFTRPRSERLSRNPDGGSDRAGWLHRWSVRLAQLSLLPALALTLLPPDEEGTAAAAEATWLLLGTSVALEPVDRSLLVVAIIVYAVALAAVSWQFTERPAQLEAYLLVSFVGMLGVYAAADTVTFYLGFALMSFSAAGLVVHEGTQLAHRATRVYLVLTALSEVALLGALVLTASAGGLQLADAPAAVAQSPHTHLIVALLMAGFGIKAGVVPLHVWLPLAHPAAPPAASAVLSGVMVKAGFIGLARFLPLGEATLPGWGFTLVLLSLLGAFAAVLLGVGQRAPKVILAYSTISQMGYLSALIGVGLARPDLAPAAVVTGTVYAVHHGLAKAALFLGVPVWQHHSEGWTRWLVIAGLTLAGLVVAGAPFTSGFLGKYVTKQVVDGVYLFGMDLYYVLPLVATGSTMLLFRLAWALWRGEARPLPARSDPELRAWLVLVLLALTVPWWVAATWLPVGPAPVLDLAEIWNATWPVLLGLPPSIIVWRRASAGRRDRVRERAAEVPAGDVLVLEERALQWIGTAVRRGSAPLIAVRERLREAGREVAGSWADRVTEPLTRAAAALGSFRGAGIVLLVVLVLLVLVQEVWS